ncbi:MAG: LamG domain-containing protein [Planctomycetota bacterium]
MKLLYLRISIAATALCLVSPAACQDITTGLVGHWTFDETSGSTAADSSGNGNDGTATNHSWDSNGRIDGCIELDGWYDYVSITNAASLQISGQITISAWVKPDTVSGPHCIVGHGPTGSSVQNTYLYAWYDDWLGGSNNGSDQYALSDATASDWTHLVSVYNGTQWQLFVNGVLADTQTTSQGAVNVSGRWGIGSPSSHSNRFFDGLIDDVRIYSRGLTEADVDALFIEGWATKRLLLVTQNQALGSKEIARKQQFEDWGYAVSTLPDSASQSEYDALSDKVDVAYIVCEVDSSVVGTKLRNATIGVVFEESGLLDDFGFADGSGNPSNFGTLTVTDNSHPITSSFSIGALPFSSPDAPVRSYDGTVAPGLQTLADWGSNTAVGAVDLGATLRGSHSGKTVAVGRRVGIALQDSFDWDDLTADGLTLFQNALLWAARPTGAVNVEAVDTPLTITFDENFPGVVLVGDQINNARLTEPDSWKAVLPEDSRPNMLLSTGASIRYTYSNSGDAYEFGADSNGNGSTANFLNFNRYGILRPTDGSESTYSWLSNYGTLTGLASNACMISGDDDFSQGALYLRIQNNTGAAVSHWQFSAEAHYKEDDANPSNFTWGYAVTNGTDPGAMTFTDLGATPAITNGDTLADGAKAFSATVTTTPIADGDYLVLVFEDTVQDSNSSTILVDNIRVMASSTAGSGSGPLVLHLELEETTGTTAVDSSGNGNDSTYENGPNLGVDAIRGKGTEFNASGVDDYLDVPHTVLDGAGAVSVAFWMKTTNTGQTAVLSCANASSSNQFLLFFNGDQSFRSYTHEAVRIYSIDSIATGDWRHYVYCLDLTTGVERLYVNGELEVDATFTPSQSTFQIDSGGLVIGQEQDSVGGGFSTTQALYGSLDDFRIYNRVLSDEEVAEVFGKIGHWKLDETSGTMATDSSEFGIDLTASTAPSWTSDAIRDGGAAFVGSDQLSAPSGAYESIDKAFSIACWFNPDQAVADLTSNNNMVQFASASDGFNLILASGADTLLLRKQSGGVQGSVAVDVSDMRGGRWHQAVAVYDGQEMRLYLDGELRATQADTDGLSSYSGPFRLGNSLIGKMDDVLLYDRAMTDREIAQHYGLLLHLKLDESSGTMAADSSGFGHDGVITGTPTQGEDAVRATGYDFATGDVITVAQSTALDYACSAENQTFALSFWIKPTTETTSWHTIFQKGTTNVPRGPGVWIDDTGTDLHVSMATTTNNNWGDDNGYQMPIDEWTHVVVQANAGELQYYINGSLQKTRTISGTIVGAEGPISVGPTYSYLTPGTLDDVRYYSRALDSHEIAEIYGLIGYWKFDETSGSIAVDSSGAGNDAALITSPTLGQDGAYVPETNTGVELDGSSQYADSGTSLLNDLTEFTLAGWVRPDGFMQLQSFFGQNDAIEFGIASSGAIQLYTANGGLVNASTFLAPSKWSHLTATGDGTNLVIYVDGIEVASGGYANSGYGSSSDPFKIGEGVWGGTGDYFDGRMDEVKVFNRAVDADEARALYKGGRPAGVRILRWVEVQ